MEHFINWFAERRWLNLGVIAGYFLIILLLHDPMVNLSVFLMNYFSFQTYNAIVGALTLAGLCGMLYIFIRNILTNRHAVKLKIAYLLLIVSLLFIHTQMNFVMNIEIIHTLQFGILAVLLFPLTRRFSDTLFFTVLLGAIDEWYQYQVLYPEKNAYFDFNDLVLDQLGAGFMLVMLFAAGANNHSYPLKIRWYQSPVFCLSVLLTAAITTLYKLSLMQSYSGNNDRAWLTLNEATGPDAFWNLVPHSRIVYHVIQPVEGLILLCIIFGTFFLFDRLARNSLRAQPEVKLFNAGSLRRVA